MGEGRVLYFCGGIWGGVRYGYRGERSWWCYWILEGGSVKEIGECRRLRLEGVGRLEEDK
jgi:hypothetical protein